jgi:hypothetical protein
VVTASREGTQSLPCVPEQLQDELLILAVHAEQPVHVQVNEAAADMRPRRRQPSIALERPQPRCWAGQFRTPEGKRIGKGLSWTGTAQAGRIAQEQAQIPLAFPVFLAGAA